MHNAQCTIEVCALRAQILKVCSEFIVLGIGICLFKDFSYS